MDELLNEWNYISRLFYIPEEGTNNTIFYIFTG